ncbi:MAG: metallophosphoesterase [Kiritimatiellae bacterium]|nr:metallophosphoesterase [Kiritimatiellia bacterium]
MRRRTFLGMTAAAGAMPSFGVLSDRIARVGVMTDTHIGTTMESCLRVKAALELFKAQGAEMVVNCGDVADQHYPEGYRCYRKTVNEVFPDPASRPQELFVYAFHDVCDYRPNSGWNVARYAGPAFADMHRFLEAPNTHTDSREWKGMAFLNFPQATGMKGFLSWEEYEAKVRRACETHPGKPVFVFDHLPPAGTTFHSRQWGSDECRRVLNKFPQVVSISGHVHGSLASERQIWQGEFTAVNAGCLQTWGGFAPGSKPPPQAKENFGVLVMDIYADRLVFMRLDVRDGSSFGAPWVVPLPFVKREAPYRPCVAAKRSRPVAFASSAALSVAPGAAGYTISFPAADAGAQPFMYRLSAERKTAGGTWRPFTRDDLFSEFWKAPKDRAGKTSFTMDAAFFTPGERYRMTVAPLDWFYREGNALRCEFTAALPVAEPVWRSDDPMTELRFTEHGKPVEKSTGGLFAPASGQGTLRLPEHAFKGLEPGKRARCVIDLDTVQPDGVWCAWRVSLCPRGRGRGLAVVQTVPGTPGPLRYVFSFDVPKDGLDTCDLRFNYVSPGASLRVLHVAVICG